MDFHPLINVAMYVMMGTLGGCQAPVANTPVVPPATLPATGSGKGDVTVLRQVEVPLLGKVSDLKGMQWPDDRDDRLRSKGVEEPCNLTIHLPSGRTLQIGTRPILIVSRERDTIVTVRVPPAEAKAASLADQARMMEKLLADWHAVPNERMRALIEEFKRVPPPRPGDLVPSAGIERVGSARLDDNSELLFELVVGHGGNWNLVAVISASQ
jgi:hypothetical protein